MKKRLLSAIMALAVLAGMTGCGSKDDAAENGTRCGADGGTEIKAADGGSGAGFATSTAGEETLKAEATADGEYRTEAVEAETAADGAAFDAVADIAGTMDKGFFESDMETCIIAPETGGEGEIPPAPAAGQLTAGEWRDNDNWGFFTNLVNSGLIEFPSFGIDPRVRTAVTLTDEGGSAVVNAKVRMLADDGSVIWSAVTNKSGTAYLFGEGGVKLEAESGGASQSYELKGASAGGGQSSSQTGGTEVSFTFSGSGRLYAETEIMFIVDTTGSMGDEMLFLQSEFTAITNAVGTDNVKYSVNFYRDEGDDYVTKLNPFTSDVADLQAKLNRESADGGGDMPEAVAEILDQTLTNGSWSEESVKLAFLIFDAPPHDGKEEMLVRAAKSASEKGIRVIPVVSSNSDRDTELFARSLAMTTGGTYVFLTDDSGIGDSHLEPIIGDYEVEKLYDIIIRVIGEYRQ